MFASVYSLKSKRCVLLKVMCVAKKTSAYSSKIEEKQTQQRSGNILVHLYTSDETIRAITKRMSIPL